MTSKFSIKQSKTLRVSRTLRESKSIKASQFGKNMLKSKLSEDIKNSSTQDPTKFGFYIDATSLENIMSNYKDRVLYNNNNAIKEYPDLEFFENQDGIETLIESLKTNIDSGIQSKENRKELFGSNENYSEDIPFCLYLIESFEDPMVQLLILCAIISIVLGCTLSDEPSKDWIDGLSMIIAVIIVVMVGSVTKYQEKKQFSKLNKIQADRTKYRVIRKGMIEEIKIEDILVGDLMIISYGEIIPVDILLTEGNGIKMDEFDLTGETFPAKKEIYSKCREIKNNGGINIPSPLILSGTKCVQGNGKGIVLCVGVHSQKNLIRTLIETDKENIQSPLTDSLENISRIIAIYGFIAGTVILLSLFILFGLEFHENMKIYKKHLHIKALMKTFLFNFPYKIKDTVIESIAMKDNVTNPTSMIAKKILDIVILSISIIVIAIPEGLSSAITLSFAFSLKEMVNHKNLIRKIEACEKMGCANYICTDKTGILTTNDMTITKLIVGNNQIIEINNKDKQIVRNALDVFNNEEFWDILKLTISVNIECQIQAIDKDEIYDCHEKCVSCNKIDKAFIDFLHKFGVSITYYDDKYLSDSNKYKLFQLNPKSKRMTSCIYHKNFPTKYRLFTKGGAEKFSKYCTSYMDPNTGNIENINEKIINDFNDSILQFNKDKMRTLFIAYKDITKEEFDNCENEDLNGQYIDENNLILLAIIVINDPLHKGVKEAIQNCRDSFINVIMVTGDNIMTAASVAKECGILNENIDLNNLRPNEIEHNPELMYDKFTKDEYIDNILTDQPKILTGNTFYEIIGGIFCKECNKDINLCNCPKTDEEARQLAEKNVESNQEDEICDIRKEQIKNIQNFKKLIRNLKVMARVEPIHKYALVLGLKSLKNIVAVTGKGTNDAPTFAISDIGISMFSGTDIAKEASDIILIDDNFSSILTAIIYGRNICENIRKFLQFQLTVNFSSCFGVFICVVLGNESPLTPIQLLWINLIMDSFGALTLATEPPYKDILSVKPKTMFESLITGKMYKHIIFQSMILIGLMIFLYIYGPKFIPEENYMKISENIIIKYCYGKIPGSGLNERLIISGNKKDWPADVKLREDINKDYCGSYSSRQTLNVAFKEFENINSSTSHMTIIFNVFVFYTLFNQINCRVLDDSLNIFKRINKSYLFLLVISLEVIIQILIIIFGNSVFHISFSGLTWKQWLISLGLSSITFIVSIAGKFINLDKHIDKCLTTSEEEEEDIEDNLNFKIKKLDSETSIIEKKIDESNIYNEHNKRDNIDTFKASDFTQDSEKTSNIDNK